jgi:ATP-dependent helicase HepA
MQLLEPERVELFQDSTTDENAEEDQDLTDAEKSNLLDKLQDFHDQQQESIHEKVDITEVPLYRLDRVYDRAWWYLRRIIRSRRVDYPDHLPRRKLLRRVVEALPSESDRLSITSQFLRGFLSRVGDEGRAIRIARRAVAGGPALRERINELQRSENDPNGELDKAKVYCEPEYGNSRLDELVDFLNQQWQRNPKSKVLIAASNNPTIDYLERRISELMPRVGRRGARTELKVMKLRWTRDTANDDQDLIDAYHEAQENITPFTTGDSQLAIAHSNFRQGYNFQMADALVFYDLPWTPDHVDQWIGRVDRLGRETIDPEKAHTRPVPVAIMSIGWRGEFDEQMVQVYESSGVFERPLQLDPERNRKIGKAILSAGLGVDDSKWEELKREFAEQASGQDSIATQQPPAFGTPALATELFSSLRRLPAEFPVLVRENRLGYVSSNLEDAFSRWLQLLAMQKYYHFFSSRKESTEKENRSLRFRTISHNKQHSEAHLDRVEGYSRPPWVPFFMARNHIQRPPRATVALENEGEPIQRQLEFLDHGSYLHDELIEKWIEIGSQPNPSHDFNVHSFKVQFTESHLSSDTKVERRTRYFVAICPFDPCSTVNPADEAANLLAAHEEAQNATQKKMRQDEQQRLHLDVESELRFVRSISNSRICFVGVKYEQGFPEIDADTAQDLIAPSWGESNKPLCQDRPLEPSFKGQLQTLTSKLTEKCEVKTRGENAADLLKIKEQVRDRKIQLDIELLDRVSVLGKRLAAIEKKIEEYREFGGERNETVITTTFMPRKQLLAEQISLSEERLRIRKSVLDTCVQQIENPSLTIYTCLDITVEAIFPTEPEATVA